MKRRNIGLQYCLVKARYIYFLYTGFALSILFLAWDILQWVKEREFLGDECIDIGNSLVFTIFLLYANYSKIKRRFLSHYGIKHKAEIVKAWYGAVGRWGTPSYYLEIDFVNSKGKRKTLHTPAYQGNPNDYLKSAKCSVYEWKGFYVEADLQVHDEVDPFGYAGIPTEKKHFIWR